MIEYHTLELPYRYCKATLKIHTTENIQSLFVIYVFNFHIYSHFRNNRNNINKANGMEENTAQLYIEYTEHSYRMI